MHANVSPPIPLEFDFLAQNAPVSIMFANADGIIEFVNDWHLEHMARNRHDRSFFLGKNIIELPGIISSGIAEQLMDVYKGRVVNLERVFTAEFSGGHSGYQTIRAAPVIKEGKLRGAVLIRQDVTAWVDSEKRVKEEQRRMRALLNATTDSAILINPQGTFIALNAEAAKRRGRHIRELLGACVYDHLEPEAATLRKRMVERVLESRQAVAYEETAHDRTYWVSVYPVFDADGALIQLASFSRDVTGSKRMEQRLIAAKQSAEASYLAKTQFLANISHELRTPLNGILGAAQVAKDDEQSPETLELWDIVRESGERLLYTVNALLDLADIESHALQPVMKDFSLRQSVESVLESFQVRARLKGITLEASVSPDVPFVLVGDEFRLRQIIINLVNNAVQCTERGHVRLNVAPLDASDADLGSAVTCLGALTLKFTVEDSGVGIPAEKLGTLFESFSIAEDHLTKRRSGSGVGLSISRSLVEMLGGRILVASIPGQGSTFTFTACFWPRPTEGDVFHAFGAASPTIFGLPDSASILLVEDERINRITACRALRKRGYAVTEAEDGEQALMALLEGTFDVVLMDIQMPVMDGLKATQLIRNGELPGVDRNIPIIALTAYAGEGDRLKFLRSGMDGFVSKPYKIQDLLDAIQEVFREKAAQGMGMAQ